MSKLVLTDWLSVDGVIQAPGQPDEDRAGGFEYGGWVQPHFDAQAGEIIVEQVARADAVLFGRKTYETFAAYWPHVAEGAPDAAIASNINSVPKFVASRTMQEPLEWNNSTLLTGDLADEVEKLKEQLDGEIHVIGSAQLVQTLLRHDLVDEFVLWVFPLLLGSGKQLFADGTVPTSLELVDSTTSGPGVMINTYRRTGKLEPLSTDAN